MNTNTNIQTIIKKLAKSKFINSFKLKEKDKQYIKDKGLDTIEKHTYDFIIKRVAPAIIPNDGKQTPYHGHPTFIAEHATAPCCRNCLYKWHHIEKNKELSKEEINYIVKVIMTWIKKEI